MTKGVLKILVVLGVCVGAGWAAKHPLAEYLRQRVATAKAPDEVRTPRDMESQLAAAEARVREQEEAREKAERVLNEAIDRLDDYVAKKREAKSAMETLSKHPLMNPKAPSVPTGPSYSPGDLALSLPSIEGMLALGKLQQDVERIDEAIQSVAAEIHVARANWKLASARADLARAEWEELINRRSSSRS